MKHVGIYCLTVATALAVCGGVRAEEFLLTNGGRVEGELLDPDQSPRTTYTVRTSHGAKITLTADQVKQVIRARPEQVEYEAIRYRYPDTVQGQWELAQWCFERSMLTERNKHLERVIELDPDHEQARRALGYSRTGTKWATQDERMKAEGYRRYKGRWRTQQEIDLIEKQEEKEEAEGQWKQKVGMWRGWLGTDRHRIASRNILAIDDPDAIKALALALNEDSRDQARLLYIEALARINNVGANRILAIWAMQDKVEEVRLTCLDYLRAKKDPESTTYFISKLGSMSNAEINRAAQSLDVLGDPAAVGPLIESLVTTHKYKVTTGKAGQTSTSFSSAGPGGLSVGSSTKVISRTLSNRAVLDALVKLTGGVNFGFDEGQWKAWYASQMSRPGLDARRD